jgi:hypothetical protein
MVAHYMIHNIYKGYKNKFQKKNKKKTEMKKNKKKTNKHDNKKEEIHI